MVGHRDAQQGAPVQGESNRLTTEAGTSHAGREEQPVGVVPGEASIRQTRLRVRRQASKDGRGGGRRTYAPVREGGRGIDKADDQHAKYDKTPARAERADAENSRHGGRGEGEVAVGSATKIATTAHHVAPPGEPARHRATCGAEVGMVICSIALLTKRKVFWYTGMLIGVLALATTASAYPIPHHPHTHRRGRPPRTRPTDPVRRRSGRGGRRRSGGLVAAPSRCSPACRCSCACRRGTT